MSDEVYQFPIDQVPFPMGADVAVSVCHAWFLLQQLPKPAFSVTPQRTWSESDTTIKY